MWRNTPNSSRSASPFPSPLQRRQTLGRATQNHAAWQIPRRQSMPQPPAISPSLTGMLANMHKQTNQDERPPEQDAYRTLSDQLGTIHLGSNRSNISYEDFSFNRGFIPNVDFNHSQFSAFSDLKGCNASHANFSFCELPFARFQHATLNSAKFNETDLHGANFDQAKLGLVNKVQPLFLPISQDISSRLLQLFPLLTPRLTQQKLAAASFQKADLSGASFQKANLEGCNFQEADLSRVKFKDANLQNVDLQTAKLVGVDLTEAKYLKGTKINISRIIEDELAAHQDQADPLTELNLTRIKHISEGKPHYSAKAYAPIAKQVLELAELSITKGLSLGLHDTELSDKLHDIVEAKQTGKISQEQLEQDFRHYYQKAEELVQYRDLEPEEYLPFIFKSIHNQLMANHQAPEPG